METTEQNTTPAKPKLLQRVLGKFITRQPVSEKPTESSNQTIIPQSTTVQAQARLDILEETPTEFQATTSGKAAREARMAAYAATKVETQQQTPIVESSSKTTVQVIARPQVEPSSHRLHPAFQEVRRSTQTLSITKSEMPWLEQQSTVVPLVEITLSGSDGKRFFYGSAIVENLLMKKINRYYQLTNK